MTDDDDNVVQMTTPEDDRLSEVAAEAKEARLTEIYATDAMNELSVHHEGHGWYVVTATGPQGQRWIRVCRPTSACSLAIAEMFRMFE